MASLANASVVNTVTGENVTAGNLWVPYARWVAGAGGEAPSVAAINSFGQGAANQEPLQEQELIVVAANPDPLNSITIKPHLSEEFLTAVFGLSVSMLRTDALQTYRVHSIYQDQARCMGCRCLCADECGLM